MTISPPAKVATIPRFAPSVLASGVDSLVLAIDVIWQDESLFEYLGHMKELARQQDKEVTVLLGDRQAGEALALMLKPFGSKGYEWVLVGSDYALTIGNWLEPKSRPSIMAEIRSETLWALGPVAALDILLALLQNSGAEIQQVKPSRVDLCVDCLVPEKCWSLALPYCATWSPERLIIPHIFTTAI